jgi:hypothetical protein
MFEEAAVLVTEADRREARGPEQIGRLAEALWDGDRTYVAEPRHVIHARGTALMVGRGGISVVRRGPDGGWRYAIAILHGERTNTNEEKR